MSSHDAGRSKAHAPLTEEHFLLQVPNHIAARLNALLQQGQSESGAVQVTFSEAVEGKPQAATMRVDGMELPARLCQLPTIVESHKSLNGGELYHKTGQVGQMLVCDSDEAALPTEVELPNGLAPPTADVRCTCSVERGGCSIQRLDAEQPPHQCDGFVTSPAGDRHLHEHGACRCQAS